MKWSQFQSDVSITHLLYLVFASGMIFLTLESCQTTEVKAKEPVFVDLSHAYDKQTPFWPTADGFQLDTVAYGMSPGDYFYSAFFKFCIHLQIQRGFG